MASLTAMTGNISTPSCGHRAQADDAGRRLFGAADDAVEQLAALLVERADQVGAVVHRDVRLVVERGLDVPVVGRVVLALDGVDRDPVVRHERGRDVVLRGERVGGGQAPRRRRRPAATRIRLAVSVVTCRQAEMRMPCQRPLLREALLDQVEHRHLARRPLHAEPALVGQADVLDVVIVAHSEKGTS